MEKQQNIQANSILNRYLVIRIVLFSTIITVFITILQLYTDYRSDYQRLRIEQDNILSSYRNSLALSVWLMDVELIKTQLTGIATVPDISYVSLITTENDVWEAGDRLEEHFLESKFKIENAIEKDKILIGELLVQSNLVNIYKNLIKKATVIFLSNGVKTFIVAAFILLLVNQVISKPLIKMICFFNSFKLEHDHPPLMLNRKMFQAGDELDQTASAINMMSLHLVESYNEVKSTQDKLRSIYNNLPVILWAINEANEFTIFEGSKELVVLEIEPEQVIGRFVFEVFKDNYAMLKGVEMGLAGGQNDFEVIVKGAVYYAVITPIWGANRKVNGVYGVAINITDRKKLADERDTLRKYLINIIDSMPSALVGVNLEGRVTLWNRKAEKVTDLSKSEAIGKSLTNAIPWLEGEMAKINNTIITRSEKSELKRSRNKHNQIFYENVTIYPLVANGVDGAVIRIDDVTMQNQLEEELAHRRKMEAIGVLAGGVAHDFNNMLGAIMGATELLESQLPNDPGPRQQLQIVSDATNRAADLVRKLLAFARQDPHSLSAIDVHVVIKETIVLLKTTMDLRINLEVNLEANSSTIIGDKSQLQNILLNMGINSAHAMPDGGELSILTRELELDATYCDSSTFDIQPGNYLEIEIRDTGCGIARADQAKIFDPFFTTKEPSKGTGLGLSSAYGIVQQHHGAIRVASEPGLGTVFHIVLPITDRNSGCENVNMITEIVQKGSGRILLVEDELMLRDIAKEILNGLGYEVVCAKDGQEALDIFKGEAGAFDLVILDMLMPRMNGRDCFLVLKQLDKNVRVLLSSGFFDDTVLKEMKLRGLLGVIQKPYRRASLSQIVCSVLKS